MNFIIFNSIKDRNQFLNHQIQKLSQKKYFCLLHTVNFLNEWYCDYEIIMGSSNSFKNLNNDDFDKARWLLGGFSYTFKAQIEPKCTNTSDSTVKFPEVAFFEPTTLLYVKKNEPLKVYFEGTQDEIQFNDLFPKNFLLSYHFVENTINETEYQQKIQQIFNYLKRGDIYEVNFAVEYIIHELKINPINFYQKLIKNSPTPQSGILKWENQWLICASQERFLKRKNSLLISQPIKGTIKKTEKNDIQNVMNLFHSSKNRSENVMIVDLVRNDLNRVCKPSSVKVERLYQIQSYEYLHQMVSTIIGELVSQTTNLDIIKSLFPAGSMTGCPKIRAMQIIEELEKKGRGIYSGSMGYFHQGSFDLNVVIRSLVWHEAHQIGTFHVGGAITLNSDWETEYQECLIKAQAILNTLKK